MKQKVKATKARKSRANGEGRAQQRRLSLPIFGFRDAEVRLLKAKLATKIAQLIEEKAGPKLRLPSGQVCAAVIAEAFS